MRRSQPPWCWHRAPPASRPSPRPSRRRNSRRPMPSHPLTAKRRRRTRLSDLDDLVLEAAQAAIPVRSAGAASGARRAGPRRSGRQGRAVPGQRVARPHHRLEAGRYRSRREARRRRDPARRRALAGAAPARAAGPRRPDRPPRRFPRRPLPPAQRNRDPVRRRCLRLLGAAAPGRGEGRGQAAAGGMLYPPRRGGADRLSQGAGRAGPAADALARRRRTGARRPAGRRRRRRSPPRSPPPPPWPMPCAARGAPRRWSS